MWWKKKKSFNKLSSKEIAMSIKSVANSILQDFSSEVNTTEIMILNSLVSYMDTFILKCFKRNQLKHTMWIQARLMETRIVLGPSSNKDIKNIVMMIKALESAIFEEKAVKQNGK